MTDVALLIKQTRQAAGTTQAELGRRLGISQAAVAKLERPGANPTVATLNNVMGALGRQLEVRGVERPSSVDESLVATYVRLSPAERLKAFVSSHESLAGLRAATTKGDG